MDASLFQKKGSKRIAIIGGGVSALLTLEALKKRVSGAKIKPHITLFEKEKTLGRGLAYRSGEKWLILNTPIDTMSVCEKDPYDFKEWLDKYGRETIHGSEIPRGIYGQYLESRMSSCLSELREMGCIINIRNVEVDKIEISDLYEVSFLSEKESFDICVIATGGEVAVPDNIEPDARVNILNIFDEEKIFNIKDNSNVAIMGSGQSAVDACLMIEKFSKRCNYTLISRSGVLPRVKSNLTRKKNAACSAVMDLSGNQLLGLCNQILDSIRWKIKKEGIIKLSPASFRSMELDLRRATKTLPSWQEKMIEITPHINRIWFSLTDEDKRVFFESWYSSLYFLRSAIMPESATRFLSVYNSGRLGMVWGDYKLVVKNKNFSLLTDRISMRFDYVINTTGIKAYSHLKLLRDEINKKRISINSEGGFRVDFSTMQVMDGSGKANPGIYSIGYPTQGSALIANSVELLRQKAVKIAQDISQNIN